MKIFAPLMLLVHITLVFAVSQIIPSGLLIAPAAHIPQQCLEENSQTCDVYDFPLTTDIVLATRHFAELSLSSRQLRENHKNENERSRCTPRAICYEGRNWMLCGWLEILLQQCFVPLLDVGQGDKTYIRVTKDEAAYLGVKSLLARARREARHTLTMGW